MARLDLDIDISEKIIPPPTAEPSKVKEQHSAGKAFEDVPLEPYPVLQARVENIIRSMGASTFTYEFKKKRQSLEEVSKKAEKLESKEDLGKFIDERISDQVAMIKDLDKSLLNSANSAMASVRDMLNRVGSKSAEELGMASSEKQEAIKQLKELRDTLAESVDSSVEYFNSLIEQVTSEVILAANEGFSKKLVEAAKRQRKEVQVVEEKAYKLRLDAEEKEAVRIEKQKEKQLDQFKALYTKQIASEKAFEEANKYIASEGAGLVKSGEITKNRMQREARAIYDRIYEQTLAMGVEIPFSDEEITKFIRSYEGKDLRAAIKSGAKPRTLPPLPVEDISSYVPEKKDTFEELVKSFEEAYDRFEFVNEEIRRIRSTAIDVGPPTEEQAIVLPKYEEEASTLESILEELDRRLKRTPPPKPKGTSEDMPIDLKEYFDDVLPSKYNLGLDIPEAGGPKKELSVFAQVQSVASILREITQTFINVRDIFISPMNTMFEILEDTSKNPLKGSSDTVAKIGNQITSMQEKAGEVVGTVAGGIMGATAGAAGAAAGTAIAPGPGTLVGAAVGMSMGGEVGKMAMQLSPTYMMVNALFEANSHLLQIAENTAQQTKAFSPEILGAKLDAQLMALETNISMGQAYGDTLANIETSSAQLQNAIYRLGGKLIDVFGEVLIAGLEILTYTVEAVNQLIEIVKSVKEVITIFTPAIYALQKIAEWASKWIPKRQGVKLKDFTAEFQSNRPKGI